MAKIGRPKGSTKLYSQDALRAALNSSFGGPKGFAERILGLANSDNPVIQAKGIELAIKYVFGVPPQEISGPNGGAIPLVINLTSIPNPGDTP